MKTLQTLSAIALISSSVLNAQTYCYQNDEHIVVARIDQPDTQPVEVTTGSDASISPDGTQIAFTQSDAKGDRRIAIADIATGKSQLIPGIPGNNAFMPVWSSDGKQIVFHQFLESDWGFAQVDAAGGNYKVVIEPTQRKVASFAPFPDGKTWLCQDMQSFFTLKVNSGGAPIITEIPKDASLTGLGMPCSVAVAPDGRSALFEMEVPEDMGPEDEYPPMAIFQIEIDTGNIKRITPKGLFADSPSWLPDGARFLFSRFDPKTSKSTISSIRVEDPTSPTVIQEAGSRPSVASKR